MTREKRAKSYAEDVVRNAIWSDIEFQSDETLAICDVAQAYLEGAKDADNHPAWRMCEDELPKIDEEVLVACDNGDRNVGYYDDDGYWYVNGIGVVDNIIAWLPLPKFNPKQL